jgi:hypothetical protein
MGLFAILGLQIAIEHGLQIGQQIALHGLGAVLVGKGFSIRARP